MRSQVAVIDALKHPPPGFEGPVREHFRLKRAYLCGVVAGWLKEARQPDRISHWTQLSTAATHMLRCKGECRCSTAAISFSPTTCRTTCFPKDYS